ncbi:MAG: DUF5685 family protein [Christensenellaceae bacterium]
MFGYVSIYKPELKVKEYNTFQAYYCGLCRQIGKEYGILPRALISYDCTFLYLLSAGFDEMQETYEKGICPVSPVKKKNYAIDNGISYAAAMNILLGVGSIKDKQKDSKNPLYGSMALLYRNAYKKAKQAFPDVAEEIEKYLEKLSAFEAEKTANIDLVADTFASLLGVIFAQAGQQENVMRELGYHLGRWIYLMDAADDLEEDEKKGNYNPFLLQTQSDMAKREALQERIAFNLKSTLNAAVLAYDLLKIEKHKGILDNIMYQGLALRTQAVLEKIAQKIIVEKEI